MSIVSHHDQSRSAVGSTAFGVAGLRAYETKKGEEALINDPFAETMANDNGENFLRNLDDNRLEIMITGIAVRTRKIDEEMIKGLDGIDQVVVVGAGLDCRAWRIQSYLSPEVYETYPKTKKWFELDFKEVFDYKLGKIQDTKSYFQYIPVISNVCVDSWLEHLVSHGFNPKQKTLWLLEGFVGYLTEEELHIFMTTLANASALGSKLVATFLGSDYHASTDMHRFRCDNPTKYLQEWGWRGYHEELSQTCESYHRSGKGWKSYYFVSVNKEI